MAFWVDLHCERVWLSATLKCVPIAQLSIIIRGGSRRLQMDGEIRDTKGRVWNKKIKMLSSLLGHKRSGVTVIFATV